MLELDLLSLVSAARSERLSLRERKKVTEGNPQ